MNRAAAIQAAFTPHHADALNSFLRQARRALTSDPSSVHVVMGNEACDADSMVSSLVHAFRHPPVTDGAFVLPVMSVNRDQFALRCEVSALFRAAHIDIEALVFQDEIDLLNTPCLRLVLTDHNKLKKDYLNLGELVVEIIDHHADLGAHGHVTGAARDIAFERNDSGGHALVGSACTLVAERISALQPLEATLLLGVITLDTMNMDAKAKKGTARDDAVLKRLEALSLVPRDDLYSWLVAEKFSPDNWATFTFNNCLQYDYKQFESSGIVYGCSAILVPLLTFWTKANHDPISLLEAHRVRLQLQFVLVQSMVQSTAGPKRQLLLYAPDVRLRDALNRFLNDAPLQLTPLDLSSLSVVAFDQANITMSRKQLVPLLDAFLATYVAKM
ncbi:hypothetical protein ACHHYP_07900 [Achlya hypogyna]|uniref:DHHA2 domain-containing protein n=1 Tax=Achlya hypogyna TaxID=1202772 RepID=A0A1V9YQ66_ACHHY|nr:hypothetical protein ACHHYP_07900 [Achlya hypogyna]